MLTHAGLAVDAVSTFSLGPTEIDEILELDLTPNRADCQSVLGIAYEVAALTGAPITELATVSVGTIRPHSPHLAVDILAPSLCTGYLALVVDVTVRESPLWLQQRLQSVGLRPINCVVDITNAVMWELGQPLHAFDYDRIAKNRLIVRESRAGESVKLIDGTSPLLPEGTLVIADETCILAIAGVMGGSDSEVSTSTRRIVLESALFDRTSVRRSSRALGLRTEASGRFDKGVDPAGVARALERAAHLFALLDAGEVQGEVVGSEPDYERYASVTLRLDRVNELLGVELTVHEMQAILMRLGMQVEMHDREITVTVPSRRRDIAQEIDLIEEIGRIHGFSKIPTSPLRGVITQGSLTQSQHSARLLRRTLLALGLDEVVTLSFYDPKNGTKFMLPEEHPYHRMVEVANPLSCERGALRPSLIPSMVEVMSYNQARQVGGMSAFEVATTFLASDGKPRERQNLCLGAFGVQSGNWIQPSQEYDFFYLKGIVETLLPEATLVVGTEPFLHPGRQAEIWQAGQRVGVVGEIHPLLGLRSRTVVAEIEAACLLAPTLAQSHYRGMRSSIPVERDIAFVVDENISAQDILARIRLVGGARVTSATLFDVYVGANIPRGKRSLAIRLTLDSGTGSFTDAELGAILLELRTALEQVFGAVWRA